jgi:hypothetical protein
MDELLSWDAIDATVKLAFDYLGATTVILQTAPMTNNVKDMNVLRIVNQRIYKYARDFNTNSSLTTHAGIQLAQRKVLVIDIYAFSLSLFLTNSMNMGLISNITGEALQVKLKESADIDEYLNLAMSLNVTLNKRLAKVNHIARIIGQYCGTVEKITKCREEAPVTNSTITPGDGKCWTCGKLSAFSYDGMHWCMSVTAGRINAGLACLLRCSLNNGNGNALVACERGCNAQYMSLAPVSWDDAQETGNNTSMVELVNY